MIWLIVILLALNIYLLIRLKKEQNEVSRLQYRLNWLVKEEEEALSALHNLTHVGKDVKGD